MSIAGSVANAPLAAGEAHYRAFQIFTSNPRTWKNSNIEDEDATQFKRYSHRFDLVPYAHIPYLCNLASANTSVLKKSSGMLLNNLNNCMPLNIKYLVIHLGSHLGKGAERGIKNITESLKSALGQTKQTAILLENTSGYTNSVGSKFEEIGTIIDQVGSERLGLCFDTCHAFAAGYELRTGRGIEKVEEEIKSFIGLDRLKLIHLNDSKYDLGSRLDRHWHIGSGYIGEAGFVALFMNESFNHGSFIMETPINELGNEETNMSEVKKIIELAAQSSVKE